MTIPSLQFQEVSLCDLANAINTDYDYDIRDQLEINEILELLQFIGHSEFNQQHFNVKSQRALQKNLNSMKTAILEYVKNTCSCIL